MANDWWQMNLQVKSSAQSNEHSEIGTSLSSAKGSIVTHFSVGNVHLLIVKFNNPMGIWTRDEVQSIDQTMKLSNGSKDQMIKWSNGSNIRTFEPLTNIQWKVKNFICNSELWSERIELNEIKRDGSISFRFSSCSGSACPMFLYLHRLFSSKELVSLIKWIDRAIGSSACSLYGVTLSLNLRAYIRGSPV